MKPEEIKKALECCAKAKTNEDCQKLKCPFFDNAIQMCGVVNSEQVLLANTLDLINQYEAEIEKLEKETKNFGLIGKLYSEIKAEAIKEFAERLKERYWQEDGCWLNYEICDDIDNLLKEMGVE